MRRHLKTAHKNAKPATVPSFLLHKSEIYNMSRNLVADSALYPGERQPSLETPLESCSQLHDLLQCVSCLDNWPLCSATSSHPILLRYEYYFVIAYPMSASSHEGTCTEGERSEPLKIYVLANLMQLGLLEQILRFRGPMTLMCSSANYSGLRPHSPQAVRIVPAATSIAVSRCRKGTAWLQTRFRNLA